MSWKAILVPHDFSESAIYAEAIAREEGRLHHAKIVLLHVAERPVGLDPDGTIVPPGSTLPVPIWTYGLSRVEERLREIADVIRKAGVPVSTLVREGSPADQIIEVVNEHAIDVIIMGTHGRSRIRALVAGSVAERVVRTSPVPVMTVRKPE